MKAKIADALFLAFQVVARLLEFLISPATRLWRWAFGERPLKP